MKEKVRFFVPNKNSMWFNEIRFAYFDTKTETAKAIGTNGLVIDKFEKQRTFSVILIDTKDGYWREVTEEEAV